MRKNELVNEIIRLQTLKSKCFYKVVSREELNNLSLRELNHIYFISKEIKEGE